MKKEHIVHFKVMRKNETYQLRGLIYLEENQAPTIADFELCLKDCGYPNLQLEDRDRVIFRAFEPEGSFLIDVLEDYDRNLPVRDRHVESLAKNFIQDGPLL